jgi:hypothetical protein
MTDPNHQVTWLPTRPDFVIECLRGRGSSTNRGYHVSYFEVTSSRPLDAEDFGRLDACGLLGVGQEYAVVKDETFEEEVAPVVVDKRTGTVVDEPPLNYRGEPYTGTNTFAYWRYEVRRVCDSGD